MFFACLSAVAFVYGNGLHPIWWLLWLAPIPVLFAAYRVGPATACALAFAASMAGNFTWWRYFSVLELPTGVRLLAIAGPAIVFASAVLLSRTFLLRGQVVQALLALPAVWVSFEYILALGPNGTALNLSYTQMNFLPLLQVASVTGIWGIDFTVFLFASAVALALATRNSLRVLLGTLTVVVAIVLMGIARLAADPSGPQLRIGLAASDQKPLLASDEAAAAHLYEAYSQAISELAASGAQIVVLPEKIGPVTDLASSTSLALMRQAAERNRVHLVVGVDQLRPRLKRNLAIALGTRGQWQLVYQKRFLVPGWEGGYEPGARAGVFPHPLQNVGTAICKDMDFPAVGREYARRNVGLILVPAWDFVVDDWLHGRMAILRGVESGFALARSAKQGTLTLSDNRGRVLAQQQSTAPGTATLVGSITVPAERTLYSILGDWFAWLNLAGVLTLLIYAFRNPSWFNRPGRQSRIASESSERPPSA